MNRKVSNPKQLVSAYEVKFNAGKEKGIEGILVNVNQLEVFFNKSNALDISWVKYKGNNISFLSKNGLNSNRSSFAQNFEGGFLYTCGMDNVSSCVKDAPIHGSLHYKKVDNVCIKEEDDRVIISGTISDTALFGKNLKLIRNYIVTSHSILINDEVVNLGYDNVDYVLLYHTNYGYPFLDEGLSIEMNVDKSIPLTEISKDNFDDRFNINAPKDNYTEHVYYHYLKEGNVRLENKKLETIIEMKYSLEDFPITLEWKSMISGDYALGIEPSLTRFDEFKMRTLKPQEKKDYKIEISFK